MLNTLTLQTQPALTVTAYAVRQYGVESAETPKPQAAQPNMPQQPAPMAAQPQQSAPKSYPTMFNQPQQNAPRRRSQRNNG